MRLNSFNILLAVMQYYLQMALILICHIFMFYMSSFYINYINDFLTVFAVYIYCLTLSMLS